ncbi:hydrophobin-251 [Armillaria novae-zelandiae]|uniref:Hydrophobin n=1 Tax=Armillaria novae-zelandiae TaxID=153914 RepID=A0AA39TAL7_9AGAR|nr:hydrophobin-251 [Armillaria novae-zelandiae]
MLARLSSVALLALPLLASATAVVPRDDGASCATGTTQCCDSVQSPSSNVVQTLLGLLGIPIGSVTANVGVTCSPISVIGVGGTSCSNQVVCCENNSFNGVVALGCTPINIGL